MRLYLSLPHTTVVATVRELESAECLKSLSKADGCQLMITRMDLDSGDSVRNAAIALKHDLGIKAVDLVIANAGVAGLTPRLVESSRSDLQPYIDVNAYGQLELYQALLPMLRLSQKKPTFVYISSAGGSLTTMSNLVPLSAYGASKAMGNFLIKWLALETDEVLIWAQHPGFVYVISVTCRSADPSLRMVATEMAKIGFDNLAEQGIDLTAHLISVEQCSQRIKSVVSTHIHPKPCSEY